MKMAMYPGLKNITSCKMENGFTRMFIDGKIHDVETSMQELSARPLQDNEMKLLYKPGVPGDRIPNQKVLGSGKGG